MENEEFISNTIKKDNKLGKLKNISPNSFLNILAFITDREKVSIILEINKKFLKIIPKIMKKDNSSSMVTCLKEIKSYIKQIEDYKTIINNHCLMLDQYLNKIKDSYSAFTFNRGVYLLSYFLFKDVLVIDLQKGNIGVDGLILLVPLIKKTAVLQHLNLSYNNIGDEGCKFLAEPLKKNNSIQIFCLECNGITDNGINSLAPAIASHKTFKIAKFALNQVTFEGVKNFAGSIEKTIAQFQVIDFKYNNIVITDDSYLEHFRKCKINF
jgi:hypothetical protein